MEYPVPQFIEVEDKIVGPLTLKQFIYIAGGGGLCAIIILSLPLVLAIILCIPVVALAGALAFYKVNGKSFVELIEAAIGFYGGGKLFLWRHSDPTQSEAAATTAAAAARAKAEEVRPSALPKLSQSKLRDLAWSLDVQDRKDES
ncbi:MAG: PrgI family protein [bacterium]